MPTLRQVIPFALFVAAAGQDLFLETRTDSNTKDHVAVQNYQLTGEYGGKAFELTFSDKKGDTACSTDWAGTWSATPARAFFTGDITVTQKGCSVTANWWESVNDWQCRGQWFTGWIQRKAEYTAQGQVITPISQDDCKGHQGWRPSKMTLAADSRNASGDGEVWTKGSPAAPAPPLPSCLALGDCAIGFLDGFGPPCCDGLVLVQDYSSGCRHTVGKLGYPEGGLSCQKKPCLPMGANCLKDQDGCCNGLTCHNMGISGFMCA